ncbi:MAG TPA: hypothetical protein VF092_31750 [Longimicrobium sp.]
MYFRLLNWLSELLLETDDGIELEFDLDGPHHIRVMLRSPSGEKEWERYGRVATVVTAICEFTPDPTILSVFESLAAGVVPEASPSPESSLWADYFEANGRRLLPADLFPKHASLFVDEVRTELGTSIKQVVEVLRWRMGAWTPHDPFHAGFHDAEWSLDGTLWHVLPAYTLFRIGPSAVVGLSREEFSELTQMLTDRQTEPVGHVLFREAWDSRLRNSRSALVIGVAALEIGLKECIADLVPAAEWLAMNAPTPPVVKMLRKYLPTLPVRLGFDGKALIPPKLLKVLDEGVELRNQVAHSGNGELTFLLLEEVLLAVRDVLWLLDYYRGREWAINYVSETTKEMLFPPHRTATKGTRVARSGE